MDDDTRIYNHPLFFCALPEDGAFVIRTNPARPASLAKEHYVGKNGRPYPAVSVQSRMTLKWHTKTKARLMRECVTGMVLHRSVGTDHLPGFPKSYCGAAGTRYLGWVEHGRISRAKQLGRGV